MQRTWFLDIWLLPLTHSDDSPAKLVRMYDGSLTVARKRTQGLNDVTRRHTRAWRAALLCQRWLRGRLSCKFDIISNPTPSVKVYAFFETQCSMEYESRTVAHGSQRCHALAKTSGQLADAAAYAAAAYRRSSWLPSLKYDVMSGIWFRQSMHILLQEQSHQISPQCDLKPRGLICFLKSCPNKNNNNNITRKPS